MPPRSQTIVRLSLRALFTVCPSPDMSSAIDLAAVRGEALRDRPAREIPRHHLSVHTAVTSVRRSGVKPSAQIAAVVSAVNEPVSPAAQVEHAHVPIRDPIANAARRG